MNLAPGVYGRCAPLYSVFRTTFLINRFLVIRSNVLATPPVKTFIDNLPPDPKASYSVGVE